MFAQSSKEDFPTRSVLGAPLAIPVLLDDGTLELSNSFLWGSRLVEGDILLSPDDETEVRDAELFIRAYVHYCIIFMYSFKQSFHGVSIQLFHS